MAITIISVGNGGYNIATDLRNAGIFSDAKFFDCDTSEKDLEKISDSADKTFLLKRLSVKLKSNLTYLVTDIVKETAENVVVVASFGGMTGSTYAPLIALEALKEGKYVSSIITMPFSFEGEDCKKRANSAWHAIIAASNFTLFQYNEKLDGELGMNNMNVPIVETMKVLLSDHTLQELSTIPNANIIVSEKYKSKRGVSLIKLFTDYFDILGPKIRVQLFDNKDLRLNQIKPR